MSEKINSHDDLIEFTENALGENSSVIIDSIEKRKKWLKIKDEYKFLKDKGRLNSKEAIKVLSGRYELAISTIESIVYSK